ncbi:hypothetical protein [Kordiimonas aquimaris]|uniref:hypothetical protein n=1 Tax=Kordiimonas aquimaris TaxID=707591 RepID=UPI0021D26EBA|nr:hypothetical protein [Kordiimonas aquimaris]
MIKEDIAGRKFAVFSKTKQKNFKLILASIGGAAIFAYWIVTSKNNDVNATGLRFIDFIYPAIILIGGLAKTLYDAHLDMPYLNFTEDQFYFDNDGKETRHYWRDVIDIKEVELIDRSVSLKDKVVLIVKSDKNEFKIDPRDINYNNSDVAAIAKEFWRSAITKIS